MSRAHKGKTRGKSTKLLQVANSGSAVGMKLIPVKDIRIARQYAAAAASRAS
jgi:hypothetical protein